MFVDVDPRALFCNISVNTFCWPVPQKSSELSQITHGTFMKKCESGLYVRLDSQIINHLHL